MPLAFSADESCSTLSWAANCGLPRPHSASRYASLFLCYTFFRALVYTEPAPYAAGPASARYSPQPQPSLARPELAPRKSGWPPHFFGGGGNTPEASMPAAAPASSAFAATSLDLLATLSSLTMPPVMATTGTPAPSWGGNNRQLNRCWKSPGKEVNSVAAQRSKHKQATSPYERP
jgi:hypothetical protein